jgi:predicted amidohydrolase
MVKVAAVQLPFAWASSPQEYFDRMHGPIARAAEMGAQLIALPQHIGDMLIGVQVPVDPTSSHLDVVHAGGFSSWYTCVRRTATTTAQFYVHTFETLAKRYGVYLVAGSISLPGEDPNSAFISDEIIFHASFLFGRDGEVLGEQRQTHRGVDDSDELGRGDTLTVLETEVGRVGLIVGEDVYHPEVARLFRLQDANILVNPIAMRQYSTAQMLRGLWREVQANQVFGVEAALAGGGYHGRASIHAPLALTPEQSGLLAQTTTADGAAVAYAELDFAALQQTTKEEPLERSLNRTVVIGKLSEVYKPQFIETTSKHGGTRKFKG